MTDADDDAFVDALKGRRAPGNLDTRRAARLARYFDDHPRSDRVLRHDPQGEAQLLAYLRAQPPVAPPVPAAAPGLLSRLKDWLIPAQGLGLRHAGGALAMLGLAVVVFRMVPHGSDVDDSQTMKGLPPAIAPAASAAASAVQVLTVLDPERAARELQSVLASRGLVATITQNGGDWKVEADAPASSRSALEAAATEQGLTLTPQSRLVVLFKAAKP